ncbi:MAG: hypothetical protein WAW59_02185 [Patescibacteria group bacterium]
MSESVTTIQFHTCASGQIHGDGFPQTALAVVPIHIATPTPSVSVGVAYIRRKFALESIPRYHPAPMIDAGFAGSAV